jgi:hypothetical protein
MAGRFLDIFGSVYNKFQLGIGATAVNLKEVTGKLRARNKADSADAPVVGSVIAASGDAIQINEDAAGAGADWLMTLNRPATGMTAAVNLTLPATVGSPAQVLTTDGATGVLSWSTVAAGTDKVITDTTSLAFGSGATVAMFSLPANAVVSNVVVTIDTAFNGTPSLSVGVTGTLSKYFASTQVDLTQPSTTSFGVDPSLNAVGTVEALIATYSAGGATAGAARISVSYSIPS